MYAPYQHLGCLTPIQHRGARVQVACQRERGGMPKCKGCLSDVRASGGSRFQGSDCLPSAMGVAVAAGHTAVGDVGAKSLIKAVVFTSFSICFCWPKFTLSWGQHLL